MGVAPHARVGQGSAAGRVPWVLPVLGIASWFLARVATIGEGLDPLMAHPSLALTPSRLSTLVERDKVEEMGLHPSNDQPQTTTPLPCHQMCYACFLLSNACPVDSLSSFGPDHPLIEKSQHQVQCPQGHALQGRREQASQAPCRTSSSADSCPPLVLFAEDPPKTCSTQLMPGLHCTSVPYLASCRHPHVQDQSHIHLASGQ